MVRLLSKDTFTVKRYKEKGDKGRRNKAKLRNRRNNRIARKSRRLNIRTGKTAGRQ